VKWSKVSASRLEDYKKLVEFFFAEAVLRFRVIVVDQHKLDFGKYHQGDRELGFYKFYYELLHQWLEGGNEYLVLLDFKQNEDPGRYRDLRRVLSNKLRGEASIRDLTVIDSGETPLAQLCDLLTGAVAAEWCGSAPPGSPKQNLISHLLRCRGLRFSRVSSSSPAPSKFNVFEIHLQ
jgi:hypothetical protein